MAASPKSVSFELPTTRKVVYPEEPSPRALKGVSGIPDSLSSCCTQNAKTKKKNFIRVLLSKKEHEETSPSRRLTLGGDIDSSLKNVDKLIECAQEKGPVDSQTFDEQLGYLYGMRHFHAAAGEYYDKSLNRSAFITGYYTWAIDNEAYEETLKALLEIELNTRSHSTLFRLDNLLTKFCKVHIEKNMEQHLLSLRNTIEEIAMLKIGSLEEGELPTQEQFHSQYADCLTQLYLRKVTPEVKAVLKTVDEHLVEKYPEMTLQERMPYVGGLLFLRVIVPCLRLDHPGRSPQVTPFIKVLCKMIQNLSNGVEFGEKEVGLKPLNPVLQDYQQTHAAYIKGALASSL